MGDNSEKKPNFKDLDNLLENDRLVSKDRLATTLEIVEKIKKVWVEINDEKSRIKRKFEEFNQQSSQMIKSVTEELKNFSKLENKIILLLDYWNRESEILNLQKELNQQVASADRQEIIKKLDRLILTNAGLEKGIKEREISSETVKELRKKIGILE